MPVTVLSEDISERLAHWCRIDPGAPAIGAVGGRMLSRGELAAFMHRGREVLRAIGLGPADRVAVLVPEGVDGALTTLRVGGACSLAPVRPTLGAGGWAPVLAALSPRALVVSADWPEAAGAAADLGITVIAPDLLGGDITPGLPVLGQPETTVSGDPELLLATSGSTGPPKWVRIPKDRVVAGSRAMSRLMNLTPADRSLLALPFHHALGMVSGLLLPLLSGGSAVVAPGFDAAEFLQALSDHDITWFSIPPAMLRALMEQNAVTPLPADRHRLRLIRTGTVSLPQAVLDRLAADFDVPVIEAYGMTECPHITCNPPNAPRYGSVGRAVVEDLQVVDTTGHPVPAGEWGQVVLRGAPVMTGYLDPAARGAVFSNGWLETGDEGRLDEDGYLYLRGRVCERINRGGAIVAPAEVDHALLSHPDVCQAVTFAVPHASLGHDLAAAVVLRTGAEVDESLLRGYLAERLEPRQVPSRIVAVGVIPVGDAGKVVRGSLADALSEALYPGYIAPESRVESLVIEIFAAILTQRADCGRRIGRRTNFFLEGGDSLAALQFMGALARAGWGEHAPTLLTDNPTPAEVAAVLESTPRRSGHHLVALHRDGDAAPLIIVHGLAGQVFGLDSLARALGRNRPVYSLVNMMFAAEEIPGSSVATLAHRYAEEILHTLPQGPVHLLGFSAGGLFAHAVAAALLDRGAKVGTLVLLDSFYGVHLPRHRRLALLPRCVAQRAMRFLFPSGSQTRWELVRDKLRTLGRDNAAGPGSNAPLKLLASRYRPPRLPIRAELYAPPERVRLMGRTWAYFAKGGVRCHPLFKEHDDFKSPALAPELATALEYALAEAECGISMHVEVEQASRPQGRNTPAC